MTRAQKAHYYANPTDLKIMATYVADCHERGVAEGCHKDSEIPDRYFALGVVYAASEPDAWPIWLDAIDQVLERAAKILQDRRFAHVG